MSPREKKAPLPPVPKDPLTIDLFPDLLPARPIVHRVPVRAHRRRVYGEAPPDGVQRKTKALASHEANDAKQRALKYVRAQLRFLWEEKRRHHPEATVDADDAWVILHEWPDCPEEVRALKTNAFMGAVFKGRGWVRVGVKPSARDNANARLIQTWRPAQTGSEEE